MKTPEIWQVCGECGGSGWLFVKVEAGSELAKKYSHISQACQKCAHSPRPGYRAIPYTPEQWEAAGGVLHERIPVWGYVDYMTEGGYCGSGWSIMTIFDAIDEGAKTIIIATPAITMKDLEEI